MIYCRFRRGPTPSDGEPWGNQRGRPSPAAAALGVPETAGRHEAAARVQEEEDAAANAAHSGQSDVFDGLSGLVDEMKPIWNLDSIWNQS